MAYDNPDLLNGTSPSHVQSVEADAFVFGSDIVRENPFLLPEYFKQNDVRITTLMKMGVFFPGVLNTGRASDNPTTGHWEKPRWKKSFAVGAIVAGPDPGTAVITLTAADMESVQTDMTTGVVEQSYPREGFTVNFNTILGTNAVYRIYEKDVTVNPNTITVKANKNGVDPLDEIVVGSVGVVGPSSYAEGTGQPKSLRPLRARYENTFQITKETDIITGSNLTTRAKIELVPGTRLIWVDGFRDFEARHEYQKGIIWLLGRKNDPGAWTQMSEIVEEELNILGTEGMLEFVEENGYNINYDPNDFSIDDFYAQSAYYEDIALGTNEVLLIQGYNVSVKLEQSVAGRTVQEWVIGVSDKYISESQRHNWGEAMNREFNPHGVFMNLGLTGFALGGYTYMQTGSPELNDGAGYGLLDGKDIMIAAPFGLANVDGNDYRPYMGYEYRGAEGYSRQNELWYEAGAGQPQIAGFNSFQKTNQYDGIKYYLRSEIAPHFSLGRQFVLWTPNGGSAS